MVQPGNVEDARDRAVLVYLRVTPEVAAGRVGSEGDRPLLAGADPARRLQELLSVREPAYLGAQAVIETDAKTVSEVAAELVVLARSSAGW